MVTWNIQPETDCIKTETELDEVLKSLGFEVIPQQYAKEHGLLPDSKREYPFRSNHDGNITDLEGNPVVKSDVEALFLGYIKNVNAYSFSNKRRNGLTACRSILFYRKDF